MRGPNYWSIDEHKLIVTKINTLELSILNDVQINTLTNLLPSLATTVTLNTTLPQLVNVIALALQNQLNYTCNFSAVHTTIDAMQYNCVYAYQHEQVGETVAQIAVQLINYVTNNAPFNLSIELTQLHKLAAVIDTDVNITHNNTAIPIIAITGTNGKTTTTRLIAHIFKNKSYTVGYTTSDGIYVNNKLLEDGDTTGPISAQTILQNSAVNFAVLETARGGILRAGLGFATCDVAVITNIQPDHMGLSDIHTLADMAQVKGVVASVVKPNGYTILNADDEYSLPIAKLTKGTIAYFSMNAHNPIITAHCASGGIAAVYQNNSVNIWHGANKMCVAPASGIPITFNGSLSFMIQNALAATIASYVHGIELDDIASSLLSFIPSVEQTPGRMNIFEIDSCTLLVDFAHNAEGFKGIKQFLTTVIAPQKIGIIVGTGDRRDDDIRDLGRISAQMFDHIIIKQEKFLRGRTAQAIVNLIVEGIHQIDANKSWEYVANSIEPLQHALQHAKPNAYIVALSDVLDNTIELVTSYARNQKTVN